MIHRFRTKSNDLNCRLDQFLSSNMDKVSKGNIRKIIDLGGVHIDGRRVRKCGKLLLTDQKIEVHRDLRPLAPYRIQKNDVVFQDKHIIVLNKPPGVECQPTPARYKGTLYEALQVWLKRDRRHGRKLEIGMAQRLDRDTSGLIVFSIHPNSHKGLSEQVKHRTIGKHYLAVVERSPQPPSGTIVSYLAKGRRFNRMKSVPKGGKEAITHYEVSQTFSRISLVKVQLETGRTHQIRVHFAEAGTPLLGDSLYGGAKRIGSEEISRHCLHSSKLELLHPVSQTPLSFTADLPNDILNILTKSTQNEAAANSPF